MAEIDPRKLLQYNVTLPQVVAAVSSSNANAGGNYLTMGGQSVNVRGLGLLRSVDEMKAVVITERSGVPVFLRDVADVHEGFQPRLGQVGVNHDDDAVEGIVLLQRGEQSLPALRQLGQKLKELNGGLLPRGMKILTLYNRTDLIHLTTTTVRHVVLMGLVLVTAILIIFLGDVPISLIAALTIPCSLLFAFSLMVFTGRSANLISIGAIDFGILVDAAVIVLENIFRRLQAASADAPKFDMIADATAEAVRPVLFSVLVIMVALIPLFTMQGVPGKIFAPMSETYGFALTGAVLFAIFFAPVLTSWMRPEKVRAHHTRLVDWLHKWYARTLTWAMSHRKTVLAIGLASLGVTLALGSLVGGEFMPKLEEGNLWVRATLPQDASYETGVKMAREIREILLSFPVVTQVVSQTGRPDDGTDVTTFNNVEFMVSLKTPDQWPHGLTKDELIQQMDAQLEKYPGVDFNFSQNIQDNVEEAMSGVKGENSLKLFGDDIDVLVEKAGEIRDVMAGVPRRGGSRRVSGDRAARTADRDRSRGERALRADGRGRERGRASRDRRNGDDADSGRRPPFRFRHSLPAGIPEDAGSDSKYPAADAGRQPRSDRAGGRRVAARRRIHDLPRKRPAIHSGEIQRARPRSGGHDPGCAVAPRRRRCTCPRAITLNGPANTTVCARNNAGSP